MFNIIAKLQDQAIASIRTTCRNKVQIEEVQKWIIRNLPADSPIHLGGNRGRLASMHGDAVIIKRCQVVKNFTINFSKKVNNTCFEHFPITTKKGMLFLEIHKRRIFKNSPKINCSQRDPFTFIESKGRMYKQYLNGSVERLKRTQHHHDITAPLLDSNFNTHSKHYTENNPTTTSLLSILNRVYQPLIDINDLSKGGEGGFLSGLFSGMGDVILETAKGASGLVNSFGNSLGHVLKSASKGGAKLIRSTAPVIKSLGEIFMQGALPIISVLISLLNSLILWILWKQRAQKTSDHMSNEHQVTRV
jgi:hypothetical protein